VSQEAPSQRKYQEEIMSFSLIDMYSTMGPTAKLSS
jgi:hypothetical protein